MTRPIEGRKRKAEGGGKQDSSILPPSPFAFPPYVEWLIASAAAVALTWVFWSPLWEGGSLIGGDLFPYFFPQKAFLAEQLKLGVIPLWNPLTGHGYPTIAESQTGVCYPPDLAAYRFLSITPAYNAVQITHYIFAFLGVWLLARKLGSSTAGALLAGLSFVYGWCAPRICLEWAVVTGAYLPWAMWCAECYAECYLESPRKRYLLGLVALLTMQLLAGHFHLAFITQLLLTIYAPLRRQSRALALESPAFFADRAGSRADQSLSPASAGAWLKLWGAIVAAFLLAAVQLAPTWELKQRSQRSDVSDEHRPGYGHMPPQYWSQAVLPWMWYAGDIDATLSKLPNYAGGAGTNRVEAHLYFGQLPLWLAIGGFLAAWRSRADTDRALRLWMLLGVLFLLYTPGWCLPVTQHLPGFSFFRGPGRYGIVTSLAVALLAGATFTRWIHRFAIPVKVIVTLLVLGVTTAELGWVAHRVGYSVLLESPVVERRSESPVRRILAEESQPVRLFAPMANVANLLDVAATPVYLGIGPQEYFDPQFTLPVGPQGGLDLDGDPAQIAWLQDAGVTHIYSLDRLNMRNWPVDLVWIGVDPFLHAAFGRGPEPTFLYRLKNSRGRIAWLENADASATAEITAYTAHRIAAKCRSPQGGRIVLTELAYPGWQLEFDGQPAPVETHGMFRAATVPPGEHTLVWTYRPRSVYWGGIVSAGTLFGLLLSVRLAATRRFGAERV